MKKTIYILVFLLLVGIVAAEKVFIFNFEYDNGVLMLEEQIIKDGYAPDRNIPVEEGYKCELADQLDVNVYSFKFDLPVKVFTDLVADKEMIGTVEILNKTEISFTAPYSDNVETIICYNPGGYQILKEELVKEELAPGVDPVWIWGYVAIGLIGFAILAYRLRKKQ